MINASVISVGISFEKSLPAIILQSQCFYIIFITYKNICGLFFIFFSNFNSISGKLITR